VWTTEKPKGPRPGGLVQQADGCGVKHTSGRDHCAPQGVGGGGSGRDTRPMKAGPATLWSKGRKREREEEIGGGVETV
jgi:hypothetical protein